MVFKAGNGRKGDNMNIDLQKQEAANIPTDPKSYYISTGEWKGWQDFLGTKDICDECGNNPCTCLETK